MEKIKVITDNKLKQFKYRNQVPKSVLARDFDWLDEEDGFDGFILYRKDWYHISEFLKSKCAKGFDGYRGDSYFSGVAIKISRDGECYKIATIIA